MVFSHSILHSSWVELFTSSLKLKTDNSTTPSTPLKRTRTVYILITNFLKEKILGKKILAILLQFAKIFSLQTFNFRTNIRMVNVAPRWFEHNLFVQLAKNEWMGHPQLE